MLLFTAHILRGVFVYIMHENPELHSRPDEKRTFHHNQLRFLQFLCRAFLSDLLLHI